MPPSALPPGRRLRTPTKGRLLTLSSDLGPAYSAQVRAVLYQSVPPERVIELTHDLPPHGVAEAAFLLLYMAGGFPPGTVHLAVVDPGVGGRRAPVAVRCADGSWLVGPDNGLLSPLAEKLGRPSAFRIDRVPLDLPAPVSATFDGRDLFAPVAARIAASRRTPKLGPALPLLRYVLPVARRHRTGAAGSVLHIDRFGNVVTNVPTTWAPSPGATVRFRPDMRRLRPALRSASYEGLPIGVVGVVGSSFGFLELALREARAAELLRMHVGSSVDFLWGPTRRSAVVKEPLYLAR
ncbi:MAG: SAM-dependent chlorinase/fluorinase [Thermoplasmata archaeon]|nr:SAM-dependent chlorinase/fluorinase [Thermoplasmata archaeon]